jgi:hypothetical protein
MELIIRTPDDAFLKAVEFNHEDLKVELSKSLEKYKGLVYNDSQIKLAKTDRATLNNFKAAMEAKRKEIKNKCLAPYEQFESKYKEVLSLVDEPINEIDAQVKKFEEGQKAEKEAKIDEFIKLHINTKLVKKELIFDKKWLNAGTKLDSIEKAIIEFSEKITSDTDTIEGLNSKYYQQMLDKYYQTLNINDAIAEERRLQSFEKNIAEQEIKKEIEKPVEYAVVEETISIPESTPEVVYETAVIEEITVLDFRVWVTDTQKKALKQFLLENNIKFGKVE